MGLKIVQHWLDDACMSEGTRVTLIGTGKQEGAVKQGQEADQKKQILSFSSSLHVFLRHPLWANPNGMASKAEMRLMDQPQYHKAAQSGWAFS